MAGSLSEEARLESGSGTGLAAVPPPSSSERSKPRAGWVCLADHWALSMSRPRNGLGVSCRYSGLRAGSRSVMARVTSAGTGWLCGSRRAADPSNPGRASLFASIGVAMALDDRHGASGRTAAVAIRPMIATGSNVRVSLPSFSIANLEFQASQGGYATHSGLTL